MSCPNFDLEFQSNDLSFAAAMSSDNLEHEAEFGEVMKMAPQVVEAGVGENVAGTIQTPFDPNEAGGFAYIYVEPQEALEGAEIFNCYDGDRDEMGVDNYDRKVAIGFGKVL